MTCSFCKSKMITITVHHLLIWQRRWGESKYFISLDNYSSAPDNSIPKSRIWNWMKSLCFHPDPPNQDSVTSSNFVFFWSKEVGNQTKFRRKGDCFSASDLQGWTRWPCSEARKAPTGTGPWQFIVMPIVPIPICSALSFTCFLVLEVLTAG